MKDDATLRSMESQPIPADAETVTSFEGTDVCHNLLNDWLGQFKEKSAELLQEQEGQNPELTRSKFLLMENHLRAVVDDMETLTNIYELNEQDKLTAVFIATMHDKSRLTQALMGDEDSQDQINGRPHAAMSAIQALGKGKAYEKLSKNLWGLSEDDERWEMILDGVDEGVAYDSKLFPDMVEGDETWNSIFYGVSLHMYPKSGLSMVELSDLTDRERFFLDLMTNADAAANLSHKFPDPELTEHLMIVNGHTKEELVDSIISDDVFEFAMNSDQAVDYKLITNPEGNNNANAADWFVAWMHHVYGVTSPDVAAALLDMGSIDTMAEIVEYTNEDTKNQMRQVAKKCIAHLESVKAQKYA